MIKYDTTAVRGETYSLSLTITTEAGAVVDLTGATAYSQIRTAPGAPGDPAATLAATITAASGVVTLSLTAAQTAALTAGTYYYDVAVVQNSATRYYVGGQFDIIERVTVVA